MSSVRIISSNEMGVKRALRGYVASLKKRPEVIGVYLCGSWAKGVYTPYSDVDLMILIKNDDQKPYNRVPAYLPDRFPLSLDLFIYTPEEVKKSQFAQKLLKHAIEL